MHTFVSLSTSIIRIYNFEKFETSFDLVNSLHRLVFQNEN